MSRPARARPVLLRTARDLLARDGPTTFTLDAVAAAAGVSKGGLLYHFPSREALIRAVVLDVLAEVDGALTAGAAAGGGAPGAFSRAYLDVTVPVDPPPSGAGTPDSALVAALVAAVALEPAMVATVRDSWTRWQRRAEADGLPAERATAVRLAVDGWWLSILLGVPLDPDLHRRTRRVLEDLTHPPGD